MALAREAARRISVDGADYLWTLSVDSGYFIVVVQLAAGTGQRLEAQTAYDRHSGDRRPITPHGVASLIRAARADGWEPAVAAPPHRMVEVDRWIDAS